MNGHEDVIGGLKITNWDTTISTAGQTILKGQTNKVIEVAIGAKFEVGDAVAVWPSDSTPRFLGFVTVQQISSSPNE